jgi:predicted RNA binding protein YcfA (HicA-like mRNA interferase family)
MDNFNKPVLTKCWKKYLSFLGYIKDRVSGSHHHWKCPDCTRTITFGGSKKKSLDFTSLIVCVQLEEQIQLLINGLLKIVN